jgi:hypothetical protein
MYCPNCGDQTTQGLKYCKRCGAGLSASTTQIKHKRPWQSDGNAVPRSLVSVAGFSRSFHDGHNLGSAQTLTLEPRSAIWRLRRATVGVIGLMEWLLLR